MTITKERLEYYRDEARALKDQVDEGYRNFRAVCNAEDPVHDNVPGCLDEAQRIFGDVANRLGKLSREADAEIEIENVEPQPA